jgi:hypothetical protein
MAGFDGGYEQRNRLLGESLTQLESLDRGQRQIGSAQLLGLFKIDPRPLGIVARRQQRVVR